MAVITMSNRRSYSEMILLPTFEERFKYLQCRSSIGYETFGRDRYLNQLLYTSSEWKSIRDAVIVRDDACDLAMPDRPITPRTGVKVLSRNERVYIHHINPITVEQLYNADRVIFDLDNLVCVSFKTHQELHYGTIDRLMPSTPTVRQPNDQCPWRH